MKCLNAENCVFSIIAFCLYFTISLAYTGIVPPDPDNPGKCIYRGDTLKLGVNDGIAPCQRLTCMEDGSIQIEGCGKLRIEDCNRGERVHTNKPYPECCLLRYKCKNPDGSSFYIDKDMADPGAGGKTENST